MWASLWADSLLTRSECPYFTEMIKPTFLWQFSINSNSNGFLDHVVPAKFEVLQNLWAGPLKGVVHMANVRLLFETRDLSVEIVRADDWVDWIKLLLRRPLWQYRKQHVLAPWHVSQKNLICWLRAKCIRQACKFFQFCLCFSCCWRSSFVHAINLVDNHPWLHIQRDQELKMGFPIMEELLCQPGLCKKLVELPLTSGWQPGSIRPDDCCSIHLHCIEVSSLSSERRASEDSRAGDLIDYQYYLWKTATNVSLLWIKTFKKRYTSTTGKR